MDKALFKEARDYIYDHAHDLVRNGSPDDPEYLKAVALFQRMDKIIESF